MRKRLLFASANAYKLKEIRALLEPLNYEVAGLNDLQFFEEIPETGDTLQENALLKASFLSKELGLDCFADDSGLEVDALQGAPGVHSARFAGEPRSDQRNLEKLLQVLEGNHQRAARFRTVICLMEGVNPRYFEGKAEGHIIHEARGQGGFGYDPIFVPQGHEHTFAELPAEVKNQISHRARAVQALVQYLKLRQSPPAEQ